MTKAAMRSLIGAGAWLLGAAQFFAVQIVAGAAWPSGYSWSRNNVSDLGNVLCQTWDSDHPRYVCSPLHQVVNLSFVAQGVLLILGAVLLAAFWRRGGLGWVARTMVAVAGMGWIVVGLNPADVDLNMHLLGAILIFFIGNASLLAMVRGAGPDLPPVLRWLGGLSGLIGLVAAVCFLGGHYFGLGMGGLERVAIFGLQIWTAVVGAWAVTIARRDKA